MMRFESWGLAIVRESMRSGRTRFDELHLSLGIDPAILAAQLDELVAAGVFEMTARSDYVLSPKGWDLEPVVSALSAWNDQWHTTELSGTVVPPPAATLGMMEGQAVAAPDNLTVGAPVAGGLLERTNAPVLIEISLLGSFVLRVGGSPVGPLSVGSQRLLVFLALNDRAVGRAAMAGRMWPEASDERAGVSLRSALSRLDAATREAILTASAGLRLADTVSVDLRAAQALARRLLEHSGTPRPDDLTPVAVHTLSGELLPDWYDDWVVAEAEDWRQLRMNALEALADQLIETGRLADAAGAARAAMKVEPLRESAHATLIRVHMAEGNQSEALRVYERYSALLKVALGLAPTDRLLRLVEHLSPR